MAIQSETVGKHFKKWNEQNKDRFDALSDEQKRFVNHVVIDNYSGYQISYPLELPYQKIDRFSEIGRAHV